MTAALLVEFAGERIRGIGARTNDERLTALAAPAAQMAPSRDNALAPWPTRVLLVTTDVVARSSLGHALIGEGYEVARTASSEEALQILETRCFHLISAPGSQGRILVWNLRVIRGVQRNAQDR